MNEHAFNLSNAPIAIVAALEFPGFCIEDLSTWKLEIRADGIGRYIRYMNSSNTGTGVSHFFECRPAQVSELVHEARLRGWADLNDCYDVFTLDDPKTMLGFAVDGTLKEVRESGGIDLLHEGHKHIVLYYELRSSVVALIPDAILSIYAPPKEVVRQPPLLVRWLGRLLGY